MIESRFYIGENENDTHESRTPQKNNVRRRFGATLSTNTIGAGRKTSVTTKKVVRVRRADSSSNPNEKKAQSEDRSVSVVFPPGPVGLQLEPNQLDPTNGCKIVRFVDGGPKNPGQARKSGKLKPGDLLTKVEANGVVGSSYDDIVEILKDSCATRTVTFQSVWDSSVLESNAKSSVKKPITLDRTPERPLTPNAHNLSSANRNSSTKKENSSSFRALLPPPLILGCSCKENEIDENEGFANDSRFDITLIQSPSHAALLPHVRTPVSRTALLPHVRTPPLCGPLLPCAIKPSYHRSNKDNKSIVDFTDRFATPPSIPPAPTVPVPTSSSRQDSSNLGYRVSNEGLIDYYAKLGKPKCPHPQRVSPRTSGALAAVLSDLSCPSVSTTKEKGRSSLLSPSSVRELSRIDNRVGRRENSILSRVFERLCTSLSPIVAKSLGAARPSNSVIPCRLKSTTVTYGDVSNAAKPNACVEARNFPSYDLQGFGYMKAQVLQELRYIMIAKDVEDIALHEVQRGMEEKWGENGLLRFQFTEELRLTKTQHTDFEKELKRMYANKCRLQESKILELETESRRLGERLKDSRAASTANIHLSTVQETLHRTMGKLQIKRNEAEEWQRKHGLVQERVVALQEELESFREKEKSLVLELQMSRTMAKEIESRLLQVEASSVESAEALQNDLVEREEELKTTQSLVSQLNEQGGNLLLHVDSLETGVKALQEENEELKQELDRTKKELCESKQEIASIHESLLQNLENGATGVADAGCNESESGNTETYLEVAKNMNDGSTLNRAARCAMLGFIVREKILEDRYSKDIDILHLQNRDLIRALEETSARALRNSEELEKRNHEMLTLKNEMVTNLRMVTGHRNQEHAANFGHLLKVGIHIDQQLITSPHLILAIRRDKEVLQVALSRMERNLEQRTSQLEKKLDLCRADLQIATDSESALKSKLDETMEKLSRTAIKLKNIEEEKAENQASFKDSEEALSQAVDVIKKLEADIVGKNEKLESAEAQIRVLKESEDIICAERMELCETILGLEERLTESTENIWELRRACNSAESRKAALEKKLETMISLSVDMKTLVDEKEELQQNVWNLRHELQNCRGELELADATNSLLQSDLLDLLDKVEDQTRIESATNEQLLLEVLHEKDARRVLQQQFAETKHEILKEKYSSMEAAFCTSAGVADAKTQCLLLMNKNQQIGVNQKTRDTKPLEENISSLQRKFLGEGQSLHGGIMEPKDRCGADTQVLKWKNEVLENALECTQVQHQASRHNLQKVCAEKDSLQSEILDFQQREAIHQREIQDAVREISLLRTALMKAEFMYCAASAALEGMSRLLSTTKDDEEQPNSQVVSLADQICNIEDELRCIEDNYELENRLLHKTIDEQRQMISALVAGTIAEHFRFRKCNAQIGDKNEIILELKTELDHVRSNLLLVESDFCELLVQGKELDELKEKLGELENKIGGLQSECDSKVEVINSLRAIIAIEKAKGFHNVQVFEAERKRLSATILEMAQGILTTKENIEDMQEGHFNDFESAKIRLEDLRCALEESKKDLRNENQRSLKLKGELESLNRSFTALRSEKLESGARICQLESKIMELVENMNKSQHESSEWRSKAKYYETHVQTMAKKCDRSADEIASLHNLNRTLLSRLSKSGEATALFEKQQKSSQADLESCRNILANAEEQREQARWERDEADRHVDVLQKTATQLTEKLETLRREKHRLITDRCIAEAALAGFRRQSKQGIRPLKNTTPPCVFVGCVEDLYTNPSNTCSVESLPSDKRPSSQQCQTTVTRIRNGSDAAGDRCTTHNSEGPETTNQESLSDRLENRTRDEGIAGARLLSLVVAQRTRMGVAGAFRKWSCANNAIVATSQLHRTSKELSRQLQCTREKLLVLKSHIKANSTNKDIEPRLRMVLKPLTDQQRLIDPSKTMNL